MDGIGYYMDGIGYYMDGIGYYMDFPISNTTTCSLVGSASISLACFFLHGCMCVCVCPGCRERHTADGRPVAGWEADPDQLGHQEARRPQDQP